MFKNSRLFSSSRKSKKVQISYIKQRFYPNALLMSMLALPVAAPVLAAENILPPSVHTAHTTRVGLSGFEDLGDVIAPECPGTRNLNFQKPQNDIIWTIESEIGNGSTVYPGREWEVSAEIDNFPNAGLGDDGPNPLRLRMTPTGPAMSGATPKGSIPKGWYADRGDSPIGMIGPYGGFGFSFDSDSNPTWKHVRGDGVSAKLVITIRATAPGVITLPEFLVAGYDATPIAGSFACDPMPIGFTWTVAEPDNIVATADKTNTDARYNNLDVDAATNGEHAIEIDVLANDYDPNFTGAPGDRDEVRLQRWDTSSKFGGEVSCGFDSQNDMPLDTPMDQASDNVCHYQAPLGFSGADQFTYVTRSAPIAGEVSTVAAVVTINVHQNTPPQIADPAFGTATGQDQVFDLNPSINDPQSDDYICISDGAAAPAVGTATVAADCSVTWDNTSPAFNGNVMVPFKVCDTHTTLDGNDLGENVIRAVGYEAGDLSATHSRRCNTSDATIAILAGLKLPPTGVSDKDIVDSGYAADGVGSYSISIPVLANDTDGNGPNPGMPSANLAILTPPAADEGIASINGDELVFTPADGFSGVVTMTYRVCEDPAVQSPPYADDPNTPIINEGLPVCGVGVVSVEVLANEAPITVLDEKTIADTSLLAGFDLGGNDSDPEGDDFNCTTGSPVASNPAMVENASVTADCKLNFNPVDGQAGVVEFTYEVCDAHPLAIPANPANPYGSDGLAPGEISSRCSQGIARITVTMDVTEEPDPLNDDPLPVCVADSGQSDGGAPMTINVITNDSDQDDQNQASVVILTGPTLVNPLKTNAGGSAKMNGQNTNSILYTPPYNFEGIDSFNYTARDSVGQGCTASVQVTVSNNLGSTVGIPSLNRLGLILMVLVLMLTGLRYTNF